MSKKKEIQSQMYDMSTDVAWAEEWLRVSSAQSPVANKKRIGHKKHLILGGCIIMCLCVVFCYVLSCHIDVNNRIAYAEGDDVNDLREQLGDTKTKQANAADMLMNFQKYKDDVAEYIDKLDVTLIDLEDDLVNIKRQQNGIAENLSLVQQELDEQKRTEKQQYDSMKLRIRYLYEHGNNTFLDALAGSTSLGDMLNRTTVAAAIQKYDSKALTNYRKSLQSISTKEQTISQKKLELEQVTSELKEQKRTVDSLIDDKTEELKSYETNIKASKNLITYYAKQEKEQEQQIAQAEAAALSGDGDESYLDLPATYTGGKFLWPVPGHYTITSRFGYRIHPIFKTKRLHEGIDISVPTGCGIYAVADGVVSISTYSGGAGNYVMVNHGGGLCSVYMHNSKLLVSVGDKVKRGQKIALSGSTGWSTGPHCHFAVRKNGKYVNPLPYLMGKNESSSDDYSEGDVPNTNDENATESNNNDSSSPAITKENDDVKYTTEADDAGDKGKKSSDLKDDSDPDSE